MKKRILSFFSLLLCLILSLSMLVSCDNTSTNVSDEASNPETSTETSSDVSGDGEKVYVADIPNKKYDGETFYIHTAFYERGAAGYTLFGNYNDSEYESNVVNDAVENRNYAVEELLDIKIVEKCVESSRTTSGKDHAAMDTIMNAGSETYHMFCPNMYSAASFSMQSRLVNLLDEEYLHDLSEPWWDSFFVKDIAINDRLDFDGVVLTKLDGDTRGGAAISIRSVVNKPLKFISSGEKMDALQVFHPERMADRILGMGDVVSLVERAQEQYDEEAARKLKKKLVKDQFNFNDFLSQIEQIKKMGNLKDVASMIPGMGKALKDVDIPDDAFKQTEAIIGSMTPAERENPSIINASRRERIAKGSGTTMADVNKLLKQFEQTRKMMKMVAGGGLQQKMAQMRRGGGFRR